MNYTDLFNDMHPGFFDQAHIRALPAGSVYAEQVLDLKVFDPDAVHIPCPEGIAFGLYRDDPDALREAVGQVEEGWVQYFGAQDRVLCACDGERIASFCIVDDMGRHLGLRVGGPGCVGTVPEYRRLGIGLELVRRATALLRREGFDLSYIHYTGVDRWYARLGYETVLRWNRDGIVWTANGNGVNNDA